MSPGCSIKFNFYFDIKFQVILALIYPLKVKGLSDKLFDQAFHLYRDGYYDLNAPSEKAELNGGVLKGI